MVRTRSQSFSDNLAALMPQARAFCPYALSAEAFAGAAFGESISGLFRLSDQTILITEYLIEAGDTLAGKQIAQVSYGYGVVPILRETRAGGISSEENRQGKLCTILMPTDEQYLVPGDRLYVLSSINGLRRIEREEMTRPRLWRLAADGLPNASAAADIVQILSKLANCSPSQAQAFVNQLPTSIDIQLYDYQAARLIQIMKERLPIRLAPINKEGN